MRYRYEWPRNTEPVNIRCRGLSVEGRGRSRQLHYHDYSLFGNQKSEILGRFVAKIKVTADKRAIFSTIREKLDRMERRLGCPLKFETDDRRGKDSAGGKVTLTCFVYEPLSGKAAEFGRFKQD